MPVLLRLCCSLVVVAPSLVLATPTSGACIYHVEGQFTLISVGDFLYHRHPITPVPSIVMTCGLGSGLMTSRERYAQWYYVCGSAG